MDAEIDVYDTNNQPKRATFKYNQERRFCIGIARVKSKGNGTTTGKRCLVFNYIENINVTMNDYKNKSETNF